MTYTEEEIEALLTVSLDDSPTPWHVADREIIDAEGMNVADVWAEADARLIAAAPTIIRELLEERKR